jgi:hypothetical protein
MGILGLTSVVAQPTIYSPTSRIGLGQILDYEFIAQEAMGGISAAYHDNVYANPSNAASLAWLRTTSLDVGVYGSKNTINASDGTFDYWSGNITHLSLAFPIFNPINDLLDREERNYAWGMMMGLQPYSLVGYDILVENQDEELGTIQRQYTGNGGTYAVMWGTGFRYEELAIGLRLEYLFGDLKEESTVVFLDQFNSFQNIYRDDLNLGALRWDFGAQYKWVLDRAQKPDGSPGSEQQTLTFGATLQSRSNLNINESRFYRLEHNIYDVVDTLIFSEDEQADGVLPGGFSAGIFYQSKNRWDAGVDFNYASWGKYENDIRPAELRNTWRISSGFGYTPDASDIDSYLKRMTYRAGFNYGLDPRVVNDKQIEEYSISLGFTLPFIGRRRSAYGNFSFKYGERAITNGISESYFRIGFGFTAADNQWFVQSKFD